MAESDLTRDALADYALACTTAVPSAWDNLRRTGLYPVKAVNADKAVFLDLLDAYCENHPGRNFLDGGEHTLPDALNALIFCRETTFKHDSDSFPSAWSLAYSPSYRTRGNWPRGCLKHQLIEILWINGSFHV